MDVKMPTLEVPRELLDFADRTIQQAQGFCDGFFASAQRTAASFDSGNFSAPVGAQEIIRK
jgi:hypothetical protein